MNVVIVVVALLLLVAVCVHLARLVARDGLGTVRPPRSHGAELGTRIDRELSR